MYTLKLQNIHTVIYITDLNLYGCAAKCHAHKYIIIIIYDYWLQ